MRKVLFLFVAACLAFSAPPRAAAQEPGPLVIPKVLLIEREEVRPGKMAAYEKWANGYVRAFAKAKAQTYWLGMTTLAGDPSEAMFLMGYDSFAALEKDRQDIDKPTPLKSEIEQLEQQGAELHAAQRSLIGVYREDLSYRPSMSSLAEARYLLMNVHLVHFGYETDYVAECRFLVSALQRANVDRHWLIYQIVAGAPTGTFIRFEPIKSLADWDTAPQEERALGSVLDEEERKRLGQLWKESIYKSPASPEVKVFALNPKMSYVSEEFALLDPDFWTPKSSATPKPAATAPRETPRPGEKP